MMIKDFPCWFCGQQPCPDEAHLALTIIVIFAAIVVSHALIFLIRWLFSCAEHTARCNARSRENHFEIVRIKRRLSDLEGKTFAVDETNISSVKPRIVVHIKRARVKSDEMENT